MLRFTLSFALSVAVVGALILGGVALYILPGLPEIQTLKDVQMQVPLRIYSADGSLVAEFGEKRRRPVAIEDVPEQMIQAFIAAEDDRFYRHPGVDWQGILRAAINLALTGEKTQGGSTITMQVARNFFLSREKSYLRKLNEIFLALKIESELSKDEVLELYLNKIYLGQRAYGIGAAAQVYYGAAVADLTLPQIAMIAGLPKAPSTTNPISNPDRALQRREYVLRRMLDLHYITRAQYDAAGTTPLSASLHSPAVEVDAPYVAEFVRKELVDKYGEDAYNAGYRVFTTIRDTRQIAANEALRTALLQYDERHGYRGPEHHYDLDPVAGGESRARELLQVFPTIGNLYPALIVEVREQSATAFLAGIGPVEIGWDGIVWARKYITENVRGPAPKTAGDVLEVGDVVRIVEAREGNWKLSQIPAVEGALISVNPDDGAIYAMVGGLDFNRSKFNRVTQARRQPGSSFKPFIYSAALEQGFTAASIINDAPVVFDDPGIEEIWRPENYSGKYYGPTRLREALIHSRNLVSIRLLHAIGVPTALEHLERFGFDTDELPHNLSLALGSGAVSPWQMAKAYSVFANGGFRVEPYLIERIVTVDGEPVYQAAPLVVCRECPEPEPDPAAPAGTEQDAPAEPGATPRPAATGDTATVEPGSEPAATAGVQEPDREADATVMPPPADAAATTAPADEEALRRAPRVVNAQNIWIMNSITRDVIREGTGRRALELKRPDLSGKTGTTNDQRDAWFVGFNPDIVTISWVGFDKFEPLGGYETGGRAALPMWVEYMRVALRDIPQSILERPDGLVNVRIDPVTGNLANVDNPNGIFEVFQSGTVPTSADDPSGLSPILEEEESRKLPEQLF